jgi:hypothetical protein
VIVTLASLCLLFALLALAAVRLGMAVDEKEERE